MIIFSLLLWISVLSVQGQPAATGTDVPTPPAPPPAASSAAIAAAPAASASPPPAATPAPAPPIPAAIKEAPEKEDAEKGSPEHEGGEITDWLIGGGALLLVICAWIQIGWMKRTEQAIASQAKWMEGTAGAIRQQAEALEKTVAALSNAAEKELRAYLTVKLEPANNLDPLYTESLHPYRAFFDFKLTVQNWGKTPAFDVRFTGGNSGLFPHPLPADWNEIKPVDRTLPTTSATLGAGESKILAVEKQFYTQDELMEFTNPDATARRIYAFGRIEYRDVFGKPRFTDYCLVLLPTPGSIVLRLLTCERGNETDLAKA